MDYEFVQKYMEPKRTGNIIRDLNPMSKLNLMLVLGLSPFIVQNYIYGFGMVLFFILVSAAAGCFRSFFPCIGKCCFYLEYFFFWLKLRLRRENMFYLKYGGSVSQKKA